MSARDDARSRWNPTPHSRARKTQNHGHDLDVGHDDRHRTREIRISLPVFRGRDVTSGDDGVCQSHRGDEYAGGGVGEGGCASGLVSFQLFPHMPFSVARFPALGGCGS